MQASLFLPHLQLMNKEEVGHSSPWHELNTHRPSQAANEDIDQNLKIHLLNEDIDQNLKTSQASSWPSS